MKTLVKSVLLAATVGLFTIPASASSFIAVSPVATQDTVVKDTVVTDTTKKETPSMYLAQDEVTYTKIENSTLPEAVNKGIATKYADYKVEEAYKGSDNNYKVVIKKDDAKLTVIYNEAGEFVKEETKAAETTMA